MDDISILLLYVAVDRYLKTGGKLGFIITQTIFKSEGGGAGFRRFQLGGRDAMKVLFVDDLSELQPFEGATNRTSAVIVEKGRHTTYPVQYSYWRKRQARIPLPADASLDDVLVNTRISRWVAKPVDTSNIASPWLTGKEHALAGLAKCVGRSSYRARMGVHCHGNGAYWLEIQGAQPDDLYVVSNIPEAGRRDVDSVQTAIESHFVYPLLRGKDVQQWIATPTYCILIPHTADRPSKAYPVDLMQTEYPRTFKYVNHFKSFLESRTGYRQFFDPSVDPYYSLYNVGRYTFAPFKVVWRYIASEFTCAVVDCTKMPNGDVKPLIPETKLVLVPFSESGEQEAHYMCSCLSSSMNRFLVRSYAVNIQIATHVLNYIAVPEFELANSIHCRLAASSQQAHSAAAAGDTGLVRKVEAEIDALAAQLWGLTETELTDIQQSLAELE